ncbi:hypothetical protein BAU17_02040 [Enterococcus sp. CU12B]|uniref:Mga helix-turn-helix domain-containing protein n=2 Tax=Candidatus Enterococcus willemsii TaxID=1857215 RepID=A0ABQ6YWW0_9ENTE|nr:hypothetical protein BAU17_02040 [Enterococcus sp. CU12B]
MLGFEKSMWLLFDIVKILDNQTTAISSERLLQLLGYSNITQVKKACQELKDLITTCYAPQEMTLAISKRHGMRLYHESNCSFHPLFNQIASKDLAYSIYQTLLFQRSVSTDTFFEQHFISLSTLRRKVKEINQYLNTIGLHITLGQRLTIRGKESMIRSFTFLFLFMLHRQMSNVNRVTDSSPYFDLAKKLNHSLQLNFLDYQEEILAIHLFIATSAIEKNQHINFSEEDFPYIEAIKFPKKVNFLPHWTEDDWKFLLLTMHNSNLANYDSPIDLTAIQFPELDRDFATWVTLFEKYFSPFDTTQTEYLYNHFQKMYLASFFLKTDQKLLSAFPGVNFQQNEQLHSYYLKQFDHFWQAFSAQCGEWVNNHFEMQSLLLCQYFLPPTEFLPTIHIYFYTDLDLLFSANTQNAICSYFASNYIIKFVSTVEESDLVIGTLHPLRSQNLLSKPLIIIHGLLTQHDYNHLEEIFHQLLA